MIKISEHLSIEGPITFFHMPYETTGSFSYFHHCNTALKNLRLELNQGAISEWVRVECPKCNKTIWVAELKTDEKYFPKDYGCRHVVTEKRKCVRCGKPTNQWDCYMYNFTRKGDIQCYCSEKCGEVKWKKKNLKRKD